MPAHDGKLRMPQIRRLSLRSFSLFTKEPNLDLKFEDGVFCLAGANGLGKSTFLAAVAYSVTGAVPPLTLPSAFATVDKYYERGMKNAPRFFRGRIAPQDMKDSAVTVEFTVGPSTYVVTRGFTRSNELTALEIRDSADRVILDTRGWEPKKRHSEYTSRVAAEVGLATFEQLVFVEHMVLSFDERRHLLFWDNTAIEQALYIAFGVDPGEARAADALKKRISKHDSDARNTGWQKSRLQKERDSFVLRAATALDGAPATDDALAEYKRLSDTRDERERSLQETVEDLQVTDLEFSTLSAGYTTLRYEYDEAFNAFADSPVHLDQHPVVRASLTQSQCGLCGTKSDAIPGSIEARIRTDCCPLCGSVLHPSQPDAGALKRLKQVDEELGRAQEKLDALSQRRRELQSSLAAAEEEHARAASELLKFESIHGRPLSGENSDAVDDLLRSYDAQIAALEQKQQQHLALLRETTEKLRPLQAGLQRRYHEAERVFVPLFQTLAFSFIGVQLGIRMKLRQPVGVGLGLSVADSERLQLDQLSESQRFFLDIALRMALADYFSADDSKAPLLLDTPEGSLDIAYESRAGEMLADYAQRGHNILMTANINTSALLRSLARKCRLGRMTLCRMTSWAELSEVQKQHETDFDAAYKQIDDELRRRTS